MSLSSSWFFCCVPDVLAIMEQMLVHCMLVCSVWVSSLYLLSACFHMTSLSQRNDKHWVGWVFRKHTIFTLVPLSHNAGRIAALVLTPSLNMLMCYLCGQMCYEVFGECTCMHHSGLSSSAASSKSITLLQTRT